MAASSFCIALLSLIACSAGAPSGAWPVVTYAQSYSSHAVDHSVAPSVFPAVAAPVFPAAPAVYAEPLVAAPQPLIAAPGPYAGVASSAPLLPSPYVAV